jgi:hypothetical protein
MITNVASYAIQVKVWTEWARALFHQIKNKKTAAAGSGQYTAVSDHTQLLTGKLE